MKARTASVLAMALLTSPVRTQVWFYDHSLNSGYRYNAGNGDADGGSTDFGSNRGLQEGQVITALGPLIDTVEASYLQYSDGNSQVWIELFDSSGSTLIASSGLTTAYKTYFTDDVFGMRGVTYHANVVLGGLHAGSDYMIAMQVVGPSWAYIARDVNGVEGSYGRDYSHFGYSGGYGTTEWTSMGDLGFGEGMTILRVGST